MVSDWTPCHRRSVVPTARTQKETASASAPISWTLRRGATVRSRHMERDRKPTAPRGQGQAATGGLIVQPPRRPLLSLCWGAGQGAGTLSPRPTGWALG